MTTTSSPLQMVTEALARAGCDLKGTSARCPAHDDRNPSLSVTEEADGKVLINCHAGCSTEDVLAVLGLTWMDLWPAKSARRDDRIVAMYGYETTPPMRVVRTFPKGFYQQRQRPDGTWENKSVPPKDRVIYRRAEVRATARAGGTIYVTEGEKDADALRAKGETATTNVGGAGKWLPQYAQDFDGAAQVFVVADRDELGRKHAREVAAALDGVVPDVLLCEPAEGKDVSNHLLHGHGVDALVQGLDDELDDDEDDDGRSFDPVELGPYLDGTVKRVVADICVMRDGRALLHRSRLNGVHGESGAGKSWLMDFLLAEQINAGSTAMLIDLEDTPDPTIERLRQIGVTDAAIRAHVVFVRPEVAFDPPHVERLIRHIIERNVTHVILDSLGEAFSLEGLNEDRDAEVAPWLRHVCRVIIERTGAGITLIDHGTKSAEKPLDPSGSKRKRAAITGTAWLMTSPTPFDRATGGTALLRCAKDRHGWFKRGDTVAALVMSGVDPVGGRSRLRLDPALSTGPNADPLSDTKLDILRIGRKARKPLTRQSWLARVERRAEVKRVAFDELVDAGSITQVGSGKSPTFEVTGAP